MDELSLINFRCRLKRQCLIISSLSLGKLIIFYNPDPTNEINPNRILIVYLPPSMLSYKVTNVILLYSKVYVTEHSYFLKNYVLLVVQTTTRFFVVTSSSRTQTYFLEAFTEAEINVRCYEDKLYC